MSVAIVEKWSAEHPIRTNADHVAEKLKEIGYEVDMEYLKGNCPPHVDDYYVNNKDCECKKCSVCKSWWDEEWKEK